MNAGKILAAGSQWTLRWREMDSNHRSMSRASRFILREVNCAGIDGAAEKTWRGTDGSNPIPLQQRVGCELDSWIMVGADGLGSKEDVRVFNLIVLAQFVWRVSSAAIPARRPQVVAPPDRMPRPYRVRRTRRELRQRVSAPMGPMVYCRRNTAGARSPRSGAPLFPRNPKAGPSFPCAWAFGDRRWRGRRQVAIGPPGLFGLVRRDDLGA
jgi:hypothetical protein